jgi:outer membrane murein-binding lipoprotein Lpp
LAYILSRYIKMSINNLDFTAYNYLTNLASVNANEVNTDVLTKTDPDISDLQFDMLEGINTNQTIQEQIDDIVTDVTTLQSEMNDVQSDVNTLQSEMNAAQSDINQLQSDVIALGVSTGIVAVTVAGLVVSQAVQDGILTTHSAQISVLQGEMNTAQSDIIDLQTKTTTQSFSALSGTTFSGRLNIGTTSAGVELNQTTVSTFGSGISSISTFISTAGTSQMSSLLVNNNFEVTNDATITAGEMYITRTLLASQKKMVLYDNNTGNDYDYLGFWTDSGATSRQFLNCEVDGNADSAFQWYFGNGLGTSRTLMKSMNQTLETSYIATSKFLKSAGASQEISLTRDTANSKVRIDMIGDTNGATNFDGQIIQEQGNGIDDNRGTMTIQSGALILNSLLSGIQATSTGSTTFQSVTSMNIIGDSIQISATTSINIADQMTSGTINIGRQDGTASSTTVNIASGNGQTGTIQIGNGNGVKTLSIGGTSTTNNITGTTNTILGTTNVNTTGTSATSIGNATGALALTGSTNTILGTTNLNVAGTSATSIGNTTGTLALTGSTNTILGTTNINRTGALTTSIGNTGALTLNGSTYTCTTTGNQTLTSSGGDVALVGTDVVITANGTTVGEFVVRANTNVDIKADTGDLELNAATTMLIKSAGTNTIQIGANDKMTTGTTTTTLTNPTIALVATTGVTMTTPSLTLTAGGNDSLVCSTSNCQFNPTTTIQMLILGAVKEEHTSTLSTIANTNISLQGITNITGATTVDHNFLIQQNSYTQPMASTFQLGYTNSAQTTTTAISNTLTSRSNFSLPSKGVWLIICGYQWNSGTSNTIETKEFVLSTTSGGSTAVAYGLYYFEEINDAAGAAIPRQQGTVSGVVSVATATTIHVNARAQVNSGTQPTFISSVSWTRIA